MPKQNVIKVFKPHSKKADFTVLGVTPQQGVRKLGQLVDEEASAKALKGFQSLKRLGFDSLTFHHQGRKIKIETARAA
mgnify:FL=1|jgi:hypothetical protein